MNVLTVPRTVGALEYRALRYPSQLLETHVVASYLSDDSRLRLAYERVLGVLDSAAGSLFADGQLTRRGQALTRRADLLQGAARLEAKADARVEDAEAQRRERTEQARRASAGATREQARTAQQLREQADADRREAAQRAGARQEAATGSIDEQVRTTVAAERDRLAQQERALAQRTQARTAPAKAQLDSAGDDARAAAATKADADRLAALAERERTARQG